MAHNFTKATNKATSNADDRLPGRPAPRFVWACHPDSWEFIGGEWLPRMKKVNLVPGVNGCRPGPGGHMPVIVAMRQDRWTDIDDQATVKVTGPDGDIIDEEGYMLAYDGQKGTHYADVWSTPYIVGSGRSQRVEWGTGFDYAGFNAWRKALLADGIVKPPTEQVLASAVKRQSKRANRRIAEAHDGNPHVQKIVKGAHEKLEAMKAATQPPKPVKARAKRRKAVLDGE